MHWNGKDKEDLNAYFKHGSSFFFGAFVLIHKKKKDFSLRLSEISILRSHLTLTRNQIRIRTNERKEKGLNLCVH